MRVTFGGWLAGAAVFALGFSMGKFTDVTDHLTDSSEGNLLRLNDDAEILKFGDSIVRLRDLNASARFGLHRIADQLVVQAQRYAEEHAARISTSAQGQPSSDWRSRFVTVIAQDNLLKVYESTPSFRQSGRFADVWTDVERFVIERERTRIVGEFLEKSFAEQRLRYVVQDVPSPDFPFNVASYPLIHYGDKSAEETPEVVVLFRYGGRVSQGAFKLIADLARDFGKKIPVRIIPEQTISEYDQFAVASLFQTQKIKKDALSDIHNTLINEPLSPRESQNLPDDVLVPKLKEKFSGLGINVDNSPAIPESFAEISAWFRDVRMSRQPMFFVNKRWISDTSPRGVRETLKSSLGLNSVSSR